MPQARRQFLQKLGTAAGLSLLSPALDPLLAQSIKKSLQQFQHQSPEEAAKDEAFWHQVRQAYTSSPNLINLNNGGVSPQSRVVQEKVDLYNRFANEAPGFYMWRTMGRIRPMIKKKLALLGGCEADTIAIHRNATESLDTIINGLELKAGDEVLTTTQDYPSMLNTLEMRVRRHGIKLTKIQLPIPAEDDAEIVARFEAAIGRKTKAILFCHMINMTGQLLPAQALCQLAREKGIYSIVDGAHSFCHVDFKISDLGCDFFATSLHKWLCAPFGTGMLHMRKELIPAVWPMYGYPEAEHDKISKFEHIGTHSFPSELAISEAIDFHNTIGTPRKEARLRYLKNYWTQKLQDLPGLRLLTSSQDRFSCGIATFQLEGWDAVPLGGRLLGKYQLYTTAFNHDEVKGIRISPNVYTSLQELDMLVKAVKELAAEGP
jgi:selenocysteine lyase/cysteine desulfurase